jgi:hypothetical protein
LEDARHSQRRGGGGSAAAASHGFVADAGSARANNLHSYAERVSVATLDFEPGSCVPELGSSEDLGDWLQERTADEE